MHYDKQIRALSCKCIGAASVSFVSMGEHKHSACLAVLCCMGWLLAAWAASVHLRHDAFSAFQEPPHRSWRSEMEHR